MVNEGSYTWRHVSHIWDTAGLILAVLIPVIGIY